MSILAQHFPLLPISPLVRIDITYHSPESTLGAQDDQIVKVLRPDQFSQKHLPRDRDTSHVGLVIRHTRPLWLLRLGQEVSFVDFDVERTSIDRLGAALEVIVCDWVLVKTCNRKGRIGFLTLLEDRLDFGLGHDGEAVRDDRAVRIVAVVVD